MEILDKVYTTFRNLDRDFNRSKKTRSVFIQDKFGGDIDIGSTIILDAVTSDTDGSLESDIEKLTFLKDIFGKLKEARGSLDSLTSFASLMETSKFDELLSVIQTSEYFGRGVHEVSQEDLYRKHTGILHFYCDANGSSYVDLNHTKALHLYNENIIALINGTIQVEGDQKLGCYVGMKSKRKGTVIPMAKVPAFLKRDGF